MFRDRTVFEALLDDFTACLLHGSHGTLGSIKTRQTTDTSTYFPLLNPLILVQSRMLREIQPSSIPIHISAPSSALARLWGRQDCPHTSPAPQAQGCHPGQGFTTRDHKTTGLCWHLPQQVPLASSHVSREQGRVPAGVPGFWTEPAQAQSPAQSRWLQLCRVPGQRQPPPLPTRDHQYHQPGSPVPPVRGSTETWGCGSTWCLQPAPDTLSPTATLGPFPSPWLGTAGPQVAAMPWERQCIHRGSLMTQPSGYPTFA